MSEFKLRILFEGPYNGGQTGDHHGVPSGVLEVPLDINLNLLAHAQCEEAFLGSQCGGHGKCGADRILILKGQDALSPPTESEKRLLSTQDLHRGVRLACQVFPDQIISDIEARALGRGAHPRQPE